MKLEKFRRKNPRKIGIAIFTVGCIFLLAFVFIYSSFASFQTNETRTFINGDVVDPGDLYFAFYVDGQISKTMPAKGEGYVLDKEKTTCTKGANIVFDNNDWSIKVLNLTEAKTTCTLYFKEETFADILLACNDTAANCLKNNASLNKNELVDDETVDHNIRYIGANPNNYVSFNNELWRIIGSFNNIDNGNDTKETRIKLIKSTPITSGDTKTFSWDNKGWHGSNNWIDSALKEVLNNGPYWNKTSGNCPSDYNGATTPCDFTTIGLSEEAKAMVSDAVWNLGGSSTYKDVTTIMFYERERGSNVYSNRPTKWTGKIGLIYPSDYGYATSGGSTTSRDVCLNTELMNWDNISECYINNWLYDGINFRWTITPYSNNSYYVFRVFSSSYISSSSSYGVFPVLYLVADIKIVSGEGTESKPYVLSL